MDVEHRKQKSIGEDKDSQISELKNQIRELKLQHQASVQAFSYILEDIANSRMWALWNLIKKLFLSLSAIFPWLLRFLKNKSQYDVSEYHKWVINNQIRENELNRQKNIAGEFQYLPKISFIVPVYNPPKNIFTQMLQSIYAQTYKNWECCIADGGDSEEIKELLEKLAQNDPRIKVEFLEKNLGISGNSNICLSMSEGDYITILDHDDEIEPNFLFEIVETLNETPDIDCIYYDEDKIDEKGKRYSPNMKPATFSPETLLSYNFLTHSTIRRSVISEIGGFNPEFDGAQDWDLFLRVFEQTNKFKHIPKVLYHWRAVASSAANSRFAKPYALDAQIGAISSHLIRCGLENVYYEIKGNAREVKWAFDRKKVSVITFSEEWNEEEAKRISNLLEITDYPDFEIILIVNNKNDFSPIAENIRIVEGAFEFAFEAYQYGAQNSSGDHLVFLHQIVGPKKSDWVTNLVQWLTKPGVGVVCGKVLAGENISHYGYVKAASNDLVSIYRNLPEDSISLFGLTMGYHNFAYLNEFVMSISKETYEDMFPDSAKLTKNQTILKSSDRLREKNLRMVYSPFSNFELKSVQKQSKNAAEIINDPYFNPSLYLDNGHPKLII